MSSYLLQYGGGNYHKATFGPKPAKTHPRRVPIIYRDNNAPTRSFPNLRACEAVQTAFPPVSYLVALFFSTLRPIWGTRNLFSVPCLFSMFWLALKLVWNKYYSSGWSVHAWTRYSRSRFRHPGRDGCMPMEVIPGVGLSVLWVKKIRGVGGFFRIHTQ